jgi:hypothetical protein
MYIADNLDLSNLSVVCGGNVQHSNIYIVSRGTITLGPNQYYGNFLVGGILGGNASVVGTVSALRGAMRSLSVTLATACFMEGTKILTEKGYVRIEQLKVGDSVRVQGDLHNKRHMGNARFMPILNLRKYVRKASVHTSPVVFTKNALCTDAPHEELYVSPNHGIVDLKGRLFPAKKFVNNSTIFRTFKAVTYYHIELASHCTVWANGMLTETYINPKHVKITH